MVRLGIMVGPILLLGQLSQSVELLIHFWDEGKS